MSGHGAAHFHDRPLMRTAFWLVGLLLHVGLMSALVFAAFDQEMSIKELAVCLSLALLFLAFALLLVLQKLHRLPLWGSRAMKYLCFGLPVLWLLGSLDHGIVSGLEIGSIVAVSLLAWGTWRAFNLFSSKT